MGEDLQENTTNSNCFICNSEVILSKNGLTIFNKETRTSSNKPLSIILNQVLTQDLNENNVHSQLICNNCFLSFDKIDQLEQKISELKLVLISSYEDTIGKNKVGKSINNKIGLINRNNEKENLVPKKILDIPSSDDESPHANSLETKKRTINTIDDIEHELEKMQGDKKDNALNNANESNTILYVFKNDSNDDLDSESHDNTDALLRAAEMAERSLTEKVKIEVVEEDSTNNSLKRKAPAATTNTSIKDPILLEKKIKIEYEPTSLVERDGNFYTCLLCDGDEAACGEAKTITQHIKDVHDARIYICDVCGDDFKKRNELSAHLDEHVAAEEGDFQCEVCNRIFCNLRLFRIHKRMHYPQNKLWNCDQCGKKYSSKNLLEEHQNTHTGVRPYVCQACGKDFASKYTFKAHEKTHEVRPRPFQCSLCEKSFLSQQNLTQHERTHSGVKDYTCHLCEKQFGSAHNLEVHSIVHTGYKPFECGLCGKAFARKAEIRDHERTHTGERPYQCEFCGATFSQRSNLQSHKRATHYDDKRYKCGECGKGFKRRRLLDYHVKAAHTGERPFKCNVCEATFVYPEHFKKHRRIHTGEKPFLCEVCGKAFNSRDNRNAHRFVHSDKKPYECLVCGAGFMRKPLLYQHMQSQGHLNDTIVVNQPRLNTDDGQIITVNADGDMELVNQSEVSRLGTDDETQEDSKLYIAEHMLVDGSKVLEASAGTLILGDNDDEHEGVEHIIIDGQQLQFAEAEEEEINEGVEVDEEISAEAYTDILGSQIITGRSAQIIQTKDGPVQFVAVRIPNDKGESEEAWIKIVPDTAE